MLEEEHFFFESGTKVNLLFKEHVILGDWAILCKEVKEVCADLTHSASGASCGIIGSYAVGSHAYFFQTHVL